jgi:hypothetical protein
LPSNVEPGESELLDAFGRWVRAEYLNPERKGCPGKSALTALALAKPKSEDGYTITHIGHCTAAWTT